MGLGEDCLRGVVPPSHLSIVIWKPMTEISCPPIPFPRTLKGVEVQCSVYLKQLSEQWGSESLYVFSGWS